MSKVVKLMLSDITSASRNKREISVLLELGCQVIVLCQGFSGKTDVVLERCTIKSQEPLYLNRHQSTLYRGYQILLRWNYLQKQLRKLKPDIISCHDLHALCIGWMSTLFVTRPKKPLLVYDSHEFELGRNTGGRRGALKQWVIYRTEKFLMKKCAFSIMVNDSIADEVQRIYKLKERSIVVRNIANYWNVEGEKCKERRSEFSRQLGVPDEYFTIMYHGGLIRGRGIETFLRVLQKDSHIVGVILGNGKEEYIYELKQQAVKLGIAERVLFHPAVPIDTLWQYVGAADVGMILIKNVCQNHYFSLPNKLFENIQAVTPVVGSDFPELRRIIQGYDIGLCVDPENVDNIVEAIEDLRKNKDIYLKCKNNLLKAKEELCWVREKEVLKSAYQKILQRRLEIAKDKC